MTDKIKELRETIRQRVGDQPDDRKVIDFLSRNVIEMPTAKEASEAVEMVPAAAAKPVDEEAVELLKRALKDAEAGLICGVFLLKGVVDQHGLVVEVGSEMSSEVIDNMPIFIGHLEIAKSDLINMELDMVEVEFDGDE